MKIKPLLPLTLVLFMTAGTYITVTAFTQSDTADLTVNVAVSKSFKNSFKNSGRLFLFLNKNPNVEPRTQTWPSAGNYIFAKK